MCKSFVCPLQSVRNIAGEEIRLQIVGDPAYPLLDWLLKGHLNLPNLPPEQESFNVYLSSVRVGVEMTFGFLKSRWRVLLKRSDFHFTFAPKVIATCCALHNLCQKEKDLCRRSWSEEVRRDYTLNPTLNYPQPVQPVLRRIDRDTRARDALTRHMADHFPLRRGHYH